MKRWLFLCSLFLIGASQPPESITVFVETAKIGTDLACSEESASMIRVQVGERTVHVRLAHLASTPIVGQGDTCAAFLRDLKRSLQAKGVRRLEIPLHYVNTALEDDDSPDALPHRMIDGGVLEQKCEELGYCVSGFFKILRAKTELRECNPAFSMSRLWDRIRPRFLNTSVVPISRVQVELFPFTAFTDELIREATSLREGQSLLASTMSIGQQAVGETVGRLTQADRTAFMTADAGLLLREENSSVLALSAMQSRLQILPMTRNDAFSAFYHWKILVRNDGAESVVTSMNLSSPAKISYTDAVYRFDDAHVADELRHLLVAAIREQCEAAADFECMKNVLQSKPEEGEKWSTLFRSACESFRTSYQIDAPEPHRRHFYQPHDSDLPAVIARLVGEANSEVIILTYQLTYRGIEAALTKARRRGVTVRIIASEETALDPKLDEEVSLAVDSRRFHSALPSPHMKVLLVDRRKMLFGTGNFTYGGLEKARELFAVTEDVNAITTMLQVARSLERAAPPEKRVISSIGKLAERQVVAPPLTPEGGVIPASPATEEIVARYTEPLSTQRQVNFLQVRSEARERLKDCGLGEMIFISRDEFADCLAETSLVEKRAEVK